MPFLSGCKEAGNLLPEGQDGAGGDSCRLGHSLILVLRRKQDRQPEVTTLTCYGPNIQKRILVS